MIFNLHPLLGLIPLLIYIVLLIKGYDLVFSTFATIIIAGILTGQTLISFGNSMVSAIGSFLAVIGFIVILGAGLGRVLTKTGIAQTLVNVILNTIGIKTQTRAIIAFAVSASLLTSMLGTSNGAIAILAPIIIPVAAKLGFTKSSVGVLLHGSACTGLFLGPFTPPTVTTLALTGLDYGTYMLQVGIPLSALIFATTFFMTKYTLKKTVNNVESLYNSKDYGTDDIYIPTKESKFATSVFCFVLFCLVGYGIYTQAGAAFAIVVIIFSGTSVGIVCRVNTKIFIDWVMEGSYILLRIFFCFILCSVMVSFITETGAFTAISEMTVPIVQTAGPLSFAIIVTLVGVFGIPGAAVAQQQIIHGMFIPTVLLLNFPMEIWALILAVGSQMTSFVIPGGDIYVPMSLAHSTDIKSMLKNGYAIASVSIIFVIIRALFI